MRLRCMLLLVRGRQHAKLKCPALRLFLGPRATRQRVAGGMLFVNSGPAQRHGLPGNVLLALGVAH